ncbi:MAG: metal-dependent hydrolase [Methanomassiliicoccales archaeon]
MKVQYLGHSAFSIVTSKGTFLIDPFLSGNPCTSIRSDDVVADVILVTHAHGDHLGDSVEISIRTGACIVATFELSNYCYNRGAKTLDVNLGGTLDLQIGRVKVFPAFHTSSIDKGPSLGQATSFVISGDGRNIYHAGDTALFKDMELISEEYELDLALLPIGGRYTMDIKDAVKAVKLLKPRFVVPMHFNTWPIIKANPEVFKSKVETETRCKCVILNPGEVITLD